MGWEFQGGDILWAGKVSQGEGMLRAGCPGVLDTVCGLVSNWAPSLDDQGLLHHTQC